jgi:hypothetical protein
MVLRLSTGPRTKAGKARAACNALRHGLAAVHRRQRPSAEAVERLAIAICGDEADAELLAAARAIAENEFVRSAIHQQKIVAIERLKDVTAIALRKGDNSFTLGKARFIEAWLAYREIQSLIPQVRAKYRDQISPPLADDPEIVPIDIKMLLEEPTEEEEERALELARKEISRQQRNEYQALEEAIPDLVRLERYERRAWSRQQRAIREFLNIEFTRAIAARAVLPQRLGANPKLVCHRSPTVHGPG